MNIVLGLNFHFVLMFFCKLEFFQLCVFVKSYFFTTLFICCQIHFNHLFLFFCTMVVVLMKQAQLVVTVDDLNFGVRDVVFEAKMFNRHGTFDRIANKNMEDPSYAYLHCDLLDMVALTTITLKVNHLI